MIGRLGRAEALAACALVVAAGDEPSRGLSRLAAQDPDLHRLTGVAQACASGVALPEALHRAHLLSRTHATALTGLPGPVLAQELGRCARSRAQLLLAPHLARWLPAYLVVAACIPTLLIATLVRLLTHQSYPGLWMVMGWQAPTAVGGSLTAHIATCAALTAVVAGLWWLLRTLPVVRQATYIDRSLEQADQILALLPAARAHPTGTEAQWRYRRFACFAGRPSAALRELDISGGQVDTTLVTMGMVPRQPDGRPDWAQALHEAEALRLHRAQRALPWLLVPVTAAGVGGFLGGDQWEMGQLLTLGSYGHWPSCGILITIGAMLLLAYLLGLGRWLAGWITGPATAWPLVADRLAQALERREHLDEVLEGLRVWVHPSMRRRLEAALLDPQPDAHPGRWLANAGVIPRLQAPLFRAADPSCLPDLLRTIGERPEERHLGQARSQAVSVVLMLVLILAMQRSWMVALERLFHYQPLGTSPTSALALDYLHVGFLAAVSLGGLLMGVLLLHASGRRWGWSLDQGGWRRLARGLVARRLLSARADEPQIANALAAVHPSQATTLRAAGTQGDLPSILRLIGWPRSTAASLDADLAAALRRGDRRWRRIDIALRMTLPFLLAVPVGCIAIGVMLGDVAITRVGLDQARNQGDGNFNGASVSGALIYWWGTRCDDQAQQTVDYTKDLQHPGLDVLPTHLSPARYPQHR